MNPDFPSTLLHKSKGSKWPDQVLWSPPHWNLIQDHLLIDATQETIQHINAKTHAHGNKGVIKAAAERKVGGQEKLQECLDNGEVAAWVVQWMMEELGLSTNHIRWKCLHTLPKLSVEP